MPCHLSSHAKPEIYLQHHAGAYISVANLCELGGTAKLSDAFLCCWTLIAAVFQEQLRHQ